MRDEGRVGGLIVGVSRKGHAQLPRPSSLRPRPPALPPSLPPFLPSSLPSYLVGFVEDAADLVIVPAELLDYFLGEREGGREGGREEK